MRKRSLLVHISMEGVFVFLHRRMIYWTESNGHYHVLNWSSFNSNEETIGLVLDPPSSKGYLVDTSSLHFSSFSHIKQSPMEAQDKMRRHIHEPNIKVARIACLMNLKCSYPCPKDSYNEIRKKQPTSSTSNAIFFWLQPLNYESPKRIVKTNQRVNAKMIRNGSLV